MRKGFAVGLMLLLSVGLLVMGSQAHGESAKPTTVSMKPSKLVVFVNHTFNVDVWIDNVVNMGGWQLALLWNKTILECVKARVNTPIEWGGLPFDLFNITASDVSPDLRPTTFQFGPGIVNDYNDTYGLYLKCEDRVNPTPDFTGSLPIVTLTFQALQTGTTILDVWNENREKLSLPSLGPRKVTTGVEIVKLGGLPILHTDFNGWVEVRAPLIMPTQHARWVKK